MSDKVYFVKKGEILSGKIYGVDTGIDEDGKEKCLLYVEGDNGIDYLFDESEERQVYTDKALLERTLAAEAGEFNFANLLPKEDNKRNENSV